MPLLCSFETNFEYRSICRCHVRIDPCLPYLHGRRTMVGRAMFSGMSCEGNQLHLTVINRVLAAFKFISGAHVFNGVSTFVLKRRSDDKND